MKCRIFALSVFFLGGILFASEGGGIDFSQPRGFGSVLPSSSSSAPQNKSEGVRKKLREFFDLCGRGSGEACVKAGSLYLVASGGFGSGDEKAKELYSRACELGYKPGCKLLNGIKKFRREISELKARCEKGDPEGCAALGLVYYEGAGPVMPPKPNRAIIMFHRGCELGLAKSCSAAVDLALKQAKRSHTTFPDSVAQSILMDVDRGCRMGDITSCLYEGMILVSKNGPAKAILDPKRGMDLLMKTCNLQKPKSELACLLLGATYEEGVAEYGINPNPAKAKEYYLKGCVLGDPRSCKESELIKVEKVKRGVSAGGKPPVVYEIPRGITPKQASAIKKKYDKEQAGEKDKEIQSTIDSQHRKKEGGGK